MTLPLRLRLLVPVLRLFKALGWRSSADARPFGDERNPLVSQALAAMPERIGPGAILSSGFLDPHPPTCARVEVRALFYDGSGLYEYQADLTPDHEDWRYRPFVGDSSDYHPAVVDEEEGRQFAREFYYHLQQSGSEFRVSLRDTPPRRFPTLPETT